MTARECMTENVITCTPENTLVDVAKMMADQDVGAIPVCEKNGQQRLVGMITDRDIVIRAVANKTDPASIKAGEIMSGTIVSVKPETSLEECCQAFERHQIRRMPVVDGNNILQGVVTLADIARKQSQMKAGEIVKEVTRPTGESARM